MATIFSGGTILIFNIIRMFECSISSSFESAAATPMSRGDILGPTLAWRNALYIIVIHDEPRCGRIASRRTVRREEYTPVGQMFFEESSSLLSLLFINGTPVKPVSFVHTFRYQHLNNKLPPNWHSIIFIPGTGLEVQNFPLESFFVLKAVRIANNDWGVFIPGQFYKEKVRQWVWRKI